MEFVLFTGYVCIIYLSVKLSICFYKLLWPFYIGPALGFTQVPTKLGKFAVVTGATDGIGKAYAAELARSGMNIYLIGRNKIKLKMVAEEISSESKSVQVRTIQIDFATANLETYREIETILQPLDIGILVNNVGMVTEYPKRFIETDRKNIWDTLAVNDMSCLMMTHIVLPGMLERQRGAIVNLSSCSALWPMPMPCHYSASKIFIDNFSRALHSEHKNSGVIIQTQRPWEVDTRMNEYRHHPPGSKTSPEQYVKNALNSLGLTTSTAGTPGFQFIENIFTFISPCDALINHLCMKDREAAQQEHLRRTKKS